MTTAPITYAYKAVSSYFWPSSSALNVSKVDSFEPVIINLPAKTNTIHFITGYGMVAAYIEETKELKLYTYSDGVLKHTFKFDQNVTQMADTNHLLYVHCDKAGPIKACNLFTGEPVLLPEMWQKVQNFFLEGSFFILAKPSEVTNGTMSLVVVDRHTYQPINSIPTDFFQIHDMAVKAGRLFITGIESNPINTEVTKNGFLRVYDNIKDKNYSEWKLNYPYDATVVKPNVLKINPSFIYNSHCFPTNNCVWDLNTLAPVLARKAEKSINEPALTGAIDFTIVVVDQKEIAVYDAVKEVDAEPPFFLSHWKELALEQSFGTKFLNEARKIECQKDNPIKSIHLFKLLDENVMAEGYENGKVVIRNLKTLNKMMEFTPPGNMKNICSFKTNYYGDKLVVHYGTPSSDGTLGIVWDTKLQKPILYITREAIKNRNYDSSQDTLHYEYGEDLLVHSEDQVLFYKGVMKSEKPST